MINMLLEAPSRTGADALRLPADPRSVGDARRYVRRCLTDWGLDDLADDATLVVSELAANAVVHAHSSYDVRAVRTEGIVRIEVSDAGPGAPRTGTADQTRTSGRGLLIVNALASAWGVRPHTVDQLPGKTVWAELAA